MSGKIGCSSGRSLALGTHLNSAELADAVSPAPIDPYDYLVDVLQRVGPQSASGVAELTPRSWKELYAANPVSLPLHEIEARLKNSV